MESRSADACIRCGAKRIHALNFEVAEDAMMAVAARIDGSAMQR